MVDYDFLCAFVGNHEAAGRNDLYPAGQGWNQQFHHSPDEAGESVSTNTLDALCKILNCDLTDIIQYTPDET